MEQEQTTETRTERFSYKVKIVLAGLALLFVVAACTAGYFYFENKKLRSNPQAVAQDEAARVVALVSEHMILPDESPNVATIADITALKDQPFFAKAKNGDHVLIYPNARKVIIFDPSASKIVDVGSINIGEK